MLETQVIEAHVTAGAELMQGPDDPHFQAKAADVARRGAQYLSTLTTLDEVQLDPSPIQFRIVTITS